MILRELFYFDKDTLDTVQDDSYEPKYDQSIVDANDTRKTKLTLAQINRARKGSEAHIKEKNKELVQSVCTTSLNLFRLLTIMLNPVIPNVCSRIYSFLKINEPLWNDMGKVITNHEIATYQPLLIRIEKEQIENIVLRSKEV